MSSLTVPAGITQGIARAKSYARRGESVRALDTILDALNSYDPKAVIGKAKFETSVLIEEAVQELNHDPQIIKILQQLSGSNDFKISYKAGGEAKLTAALSLLKNVLEKQSSESAASADADAATRCADLWAKGKALMDSGESGKGRAVLKRMAEEFGAQPGVLQNVGEAFVEKGFALDGIVFLQEAVERFAQEPSAYSCLINAHIELAQYQEAEKLYKDVLRRFGQHPKTLLNMTKLYKLWRNKDKVYSCANQVLQLDPENIEAKELLSWAE